MKVRYDEKVEGNSSSCFYPKVKCSKYINSFKGIHIKVNFSNFFENVSYSNKCTMTEIYHSGCIQKLFGQGGFGKPQFRNAERSNNTWYDSEF